MTNIIYERQEARRKKLEWITQQIIALKKEGFKSDTKRVILEIRSKMNLSDRMAKEYLELALYEAKIKKEDIMGDVPLSKEYIEEREAEKKKDEIILEGKGEEEIANP